MASVFKKMNAVEHAPRMNIGWNVMSVLKKFVMDRVFVPSVKHKLIHLARRDVNTIQHFTSGCKADCADVQTGN